MVLQIGNDNKRLSFHYYPQHWRLFGFHSNGAKRNSEDRCYDGTFKILGLFINYTVWNFNSKFRKKAKEWADNQKGIRLMDESSQVKYYKQYKNA